MRHRLLLLIIAPVLLGSLSSCRKKAEQRLDMTEYVLIYPGAPIVEMPGESTTMKVLVRNVSENKLTGLRLTVKSDACTASVTPRVIEALIPAQRGVFLVKLARVEGKPRQRYPLGLTLHAAGLPVPAGMDLQVDTGLPTGKGWIDVGQVKLIHRPRSRTAYYLLAATPLLLVLGWLLWRWSRPGRRRGSKGPEDPGRA